MQDSFVKVLNMSESPTQLTNAQPVEDCRDYLRTGRCKYGASCKYNHPPNVQNGGGMKVPIDPSEPLFPVRPNEPICQYYLKHGTCKFGQACKFNHPPHPPGQSLINGQVLMNGVRQNEVSSQQVVMNPMMSDMNGMMLQLLPQRPDEPDCIYFLKNGRCKYGATCRYHHPINFHQQQRRIEKPRRQQMNSGDPNYGQTVHYVTQVVHSYPQGQLIMSENSQPVTFINVDGYTQQGYQIVSGGDATSYCIPGNNGTAMLTEQSSSGSSIASFETANDHMGESASAHWNRAKRNGSGNNLSGQMHDIRPQNRVFMSHSVSEGNIAQSRRIRTASYGSVSDHTSYYDTAANMPRTASVSSWRSDRSAMYDNGQRVSPQPYTVLHDNKVADIRPIPGRGRPPVMNNIQRRGEPMRLRSGRNGEHDEGFTMMTSALLHMLDTPEEASGENYSEDEYIQTNTDYHDNFGMINDSPRDRHQLGQGPPGLNLVAHPLEQQSQRVDHVSMMQRLSLQQNSTQGLVHDDEGSSWSPTWHGSLNGINPDDQLHSMHSMLHPPTSHGSTRGSNHDSDIGLYLS